MKKILLIFTVLLLPFFTQADGDIIKRFDYENSPLDIPSAKIICDYPPIPTIEYNGILYPLNDHVGKGKARAPEKEWRSIFDLMKDPRNMSDRIALMQILTSVNIRCGF